MTIRIRTASQVMSDMAVEIDRAREDKNTMGIAMILVIENSHVLMNSSYSPEQIALHIGLPRSYAIEVRKGFKVAKLLRARGGLRFANC